MSKILGTQTEINSNATTSVANVTKNLGKKLSMTLIAPIAISSGKINAKIPIIFGGGKHILSVDEFTQKEDELHMKATTHNGAMYFYIIHPIGSLDLYGGQKQFKEYKELKL